MLALTTALPAGEPSHPGQAHSAGNLRNTHPTCMSHAHRPAMRDSDQLSPAHPRASGLALTSVAQFSEIYSGPLREFASDAAPAGRVTISEEPEV